MASMQPAAGPALDTCPVRRGPALRALALGLALACASSGAVAQLDRDSDLFKAMAAHDHAFFERGFNQCDLDYLEQAVHPHLRFYHDQSGFQDYAAFLQNARRYLCADPDHKPVRKLDADSLQVFPLYADGELYAVIHMGSHRFFIREPGKDDSATGIARFSNLYVLEDGRWLLKDVLSYDHRPAD